MNRIFTIFILSVLIFLMTGCSSARKMTTNHYYQYDHSLPLETSVRSASEYGASYYRIAYNSTHHERVTGILSYPEQVGPPTPVIILVHGLRDHANVDYMRAGEKYLRNAGYAVLRINLSDHGDRKKDDYDYALLEGLRYHSREIITQSVFDLRRAIDFIETLDGLDSNRIGYFGISLGGVIGTILSGVDERIKVPVIALAGGRMNFMFGTKALTAATKSYLYPIDPIYFVKMISPRPLLMINAEQDEVIPPLSSKFLYKKAKKPKEIIWYPTKHRALPLDQAFPDGIRWFDAHL